MKQLLRIVILILVIGTPSVKAEEVGVDISGDDVHYVSPTPYRYIKRKYPQYMGPRVFASSVYDGYIYQGYLTYQENNWYGGYIYKTPNVPFSVGNNVIE